MTIAIDPINPPDYPKGPIPAIPAFTVRENASLIQLVESMRVWIDRELVPHLNTAITDLGDEWAEYADALIESWNLTLAEMTAQVNDAVDEMGDQVDAAQAAREAAETARDLAETFASDVVEFQDAAVAALFQNPSSDLRTAADQAYAPSALVDVVDDMGEVLEVGRLSESALSATIGAQATAKNSIRIDASTFGNMSVNAGAAIQAAIDSAPGTPSFGGADILIPEGQWIISQEILINRPGVKLVGAGGYTTMLRAAPSLTGAIVRYAIPNAYVRGPQVENIRFAMNGANCDGLVFESAYDNAMLQNVFIDGVTGTNRGIAFIPAVGAPSAVTQTVTAINCYVIGAPGFTGHAWHLDTVQEMTLVGCKGKGGGEGNGVAFHMDDCRGIQFYGCSAAIAEVGFNVVTSTRAVIGLTIDGPTVEGCATTVRAVGSNGSMVSNLSMRNVRKQVASTIDAGPIELTYVGNSVIESGALPVTVNAGSSQVHIFTEDITKITDNGSRTSVIAWENAAARLGFRGQTGVSLFVGPNEVIRSVNAGANQAGVSLAVNVGVGASMKQVHVGAVDSGGPGFRALTVPN